MFLTRSLRNVRDDSSWYILKQTDPYGKDQIMKLIEHCRFKNNWDSLSFFNNTLREIIFIDYLLMKRGINIDEKIALVTHKNWFNPNTCTR